MFISKITVATVAIGLAAAGSSPAPKVWEASYGKALQATKASNSPLLVVLDKPGDDQDGVSPELLTPPGSEAEEVELLQPYTLCHVDVTTDYGKRVAQAFHATNFPHVAIIDRSGRNVIFRMTGKIGASRWQEALSRHRDGRLRRQVAAQVNYQPTESIIYSEPVVNGGSYCPNCQRQSF